MQSPESIALKYAGACTFPWLGNQLLQCVLVITPDSPGDGCNTLWRCKMCFGNVSGIALWHR